MLIMPPQLQMSFEESVKAGFPPIRTVGLPGTQGATVTGMQGMGVKTPKAALVAAATVGLAKDEHIPKVAKLTIGLLSIILAAGVVAKILETGSTTKGHGATPKEHWHKAPLVTKFPINLRALYNGRNIY